MENITSAPQDVMTEASDRITIVSMLYEGAITSIAQAKKCMKSGDGNGTRGYISRAEAIVSELSGALDTAGGPVTQNLYDLYAFVLNSIQKAEAEMHVDDLENAEKVLEILKDAWHEVQDIAQDTGMLEEAE